MENITTQIRQVVPYDEFVVFLLDLDGETVRPFHYVLRSKKLEEELRKFTGKIGVGYTGRVIQTGEGIIMERIDEKPDVIIGTYCPVPTSYIVIPLRVQDKVIGTINLHREIREPIQIPFQQHEFNFVSIVASQSAIVIENVKLFNQTQQHLRELELLKEQILVAIRKMQQTTNLDEILNAILDGVQTLGYKRVRLYKYSEEKRAFVGWKALGPNIPSSFEGYELRLAEDRYARETYESRKAQIYTLDKYGDTSAHEFLNISAGTIWVSVPLIVGGKFYGLVQWGVSS